MEKPHVLPTVEARYSATPVKIDGKIDDVIWQQATANPMLMAMNAPRDGQPEEGGTVRFAWDDEYFYMACELTDKDLVAESDKDGEHHYQMGDVCELFLKPASKSGYWEMYVTPRGNQTVFYFPGRGRLGLKEHFESRSILKVAASNDGTLNNWQDVDKGWTCEMAVPISELRNEADLSAGAEWRILVGRYNYTRYRNADAGPELTAYPQLPVAAHHILENYAYLKLTK